MFNWFKKNPPETKEIPNTPTNNQSFHIKGIGFNTYAELYQVGNKWKCCIHVGAEYFMGSSEHRHIALEQAVGKLKYFQLICQNIQEQIAAIETIEKPEESYAESYIAGLKCRSSFPQ